MFKLSGLPFGIGSLPHTDPQAACEAVLNAFPDSPFWPELPRRDWRESIGMEQARGLPGFIIDEPAKRIYFDRRKDTTNELGRFYEDYLAGNFAAYSISSEFMPGLDAMISAIKTRGVRPKVLKGQLTGPTTLGLILKDNDKKALLYHEQMMDVLVKATTMKAAWMESTMAQVCDQPAVFFDEPMLQSIGSAAIPIDKEVAVARLRQIISGVHCLTGGHCCGNTDWSILMDAGIDVIAFDAWHFTDKLVLYPDHLREFVGRGGLVAWGIVPASSEGAEAHTGALYDKLLSGMDLVSQKCDIPLQTLTDQCLITPSCGLGGLTETQAINILYKTAEIAGKIRAA